jgi:adenylate/guanylate cyclase family protein
MTPEDKRISFRVRINLGDVIAEPDDIYGDGVNVAARLEALAEPGGICISRVVRDQIRDKLPYPFEAGANRLSRTSQGLCGFLHCAPRASPNWLSRIHLFQSRGADAAISLRSWQWLQRCSS